MKDYAKLTKALRRASVAELLDAHVLAQATDNLFAGEQIRLECNRRPLADVLPAARGLSTDADVAKRIAAAMSLTRETEAMASAERSGLTLLLDLSDDADKRVVLAALKAISLRLQRPFDPRMAARLRAFEAHPDFDVRVAYSRIFTSPYMHDEMRDPSEVAVWTRLMQDPSPVMRAGACRHMHLCACMPEAARMVDREDVRQALRQRLGDDDAEVRNAALLALALMEDRTVPAAIDRELHHLALADATVPTQALLDALRTVSEAIGFNPDSRYVAGITRVAELVLHRAEQERDPDEPSNSNSHGFPEDLADLIQSCKAAGSKRKSAV